VGYPDPESFHRAFEALAELHDGLWERTGLSAQQTVLGGFSMGSVMSYSLGLAPGRPAPAGILAFSGFVPVVEGWEPELDDRQAVRVFIAHGRSDPVIGVDFARRARALLEGAGLDVEYEETDGAHHIDPTVVPQAVSWLAETI
jgi:phospholipase/carboxylesterase